MREIYLRHKKQWFGPLTWNPCEVLRGNLPAPFRRALDLNNKAITAILIEQKDVEQNSIQRP